MSRPLFAFALALAFFTFTFGVRSFMMWRRTGTTGFRGISGRVGSLEWLGGVGFAVAIGLVFVAPLAELAQWIAPLFAQSPPWLDAVAVGLMVTGALGTWWSQSAMGASWRVGVDDDEQTTLVSNGPFQWVRNPVFSFLMVSLLGFTIFLPSALSGLAMAVAVFSLEVQVRLVEEPYLRRAHGDAYLLYERQVGRFVPLMGRAR